MEKESNGSNNQTSAIFTGSEETILKNLDNLRESGTLATLGAILENVVSQPSEAIKRKIYELVADLKSKSTTPILANFTLSCRNNQAQLELISASWQSRLDFSDYLERYIDLSLQGDLLLAHEVLTLVEENCQNPEAEQVNKAIAKIKEQLHSFSPEKQLLMVDLVNILEDKRDTQQ